MIKVVIVDDEPSAVNILSGYVQKISLLNLVGCFQKMEDSLQVIDAAKVDLVFLDIEISINEELKLLAQLQRPPKIIITTADRSNAFEAFEFKTIDYLLKPILFKRFNTAINKLFDLKEFHHLKQAGQDFIYFKSGTKLLQVYFNEILYIEGLSNYVKIVTKKIPIVVYQKMSYLEEKLPHGEFIRVHKSYIIAVSNVGALSRADLEIGGKIIPIGLKYRDKVDSHFREWELK